MAAVPDRITTHPPVNEVPELHPDFPYGQPPKEWVPGFRAVERYETRWREGPWPCCGPERCPCPVDFPLSGPLHARAFSLDGWKVAVEELRQRKTGATFLARGWVYLMRAKCARCRVLKVGWSTDPRKRAGNVWAPGCGAPGAVVAAFNGTRLHEQATLYWLGAHRKAGEWLHDHPSILVDFESIIRLREEQGGPGQRWSA